MQLSEFLTGFILKRDIQLKITLGKEKDMALSVGQLAPDFTLFDHRKRPVQLSDFRGRKNVVLAFFPLAWTPI